MKEKIIIWIIGLIVLSSFVSAGYGDGLFYWELENTNYTDSGSRGNNHHLAGTTRGVVAGKVNNGIDFESGNADTISKKSGVNATAFSDVRTIQIWVKPESNGGDNLGTAFSMWGGTSNNLLVHGAFNGGGYSLVKSGGTSCSMVWDTGFVIGSWNMATLTRNATHWGVWLGTSPVQACSTHTNMPSSVSEVYIGTNAEAQTRYFDGIIDNVYLSNNSFSYQDIVNSYNAGVGIDFNPPPPTSKDTLNISTAQPTNNAQYNFNSINFNATVNSTYDFNCSLYLNGSLDQSNSYSSGKDVFVNFTKSLSDGDYEFLISCYNATGFNDNNENTSTNTFYVDISPPSLDWTNFINNTLGYKNKNITGQFNFSDNILLHSINVSIDNVGIFNRTHIYKPEYSYNFSYNASTLSIGRHILNIEISDGHTAEKLLDGKAYNPTNGVFNDYIKYKFDAPYREGTVKIIQKDGSIFDSWKTTEKKDRYSFSFKPNTKKSSYILEVESESPIYIYNAPNSPWKTWIVTEKHWLDFHPYNVSFKRISNTKVEATISNVDPNLKELSFNSIGDLNTINVTYDFYTINMTSIFDDVILSNFVTDYSLRVDFGTLLFNITAPNLTVNALLELDGTNITATLEDFNVNNATFNYTNTPAEINNWQLVQHKWFFNMTNNLTDSYLSTDTQNQTLFTIDAGVCTANVTYPIINFSYFDETTDQKMNATHGYQLSISDGTFFYNQTASFTRAESNKLCTNLNPGNITYNWDMWGANILSEDTYITRIVDIDAAAPITISNNPQTNLPLYLIPITNSSTVKYNWFTTNFELIDGTMRVFQCNDNGTQELIESIPIIAGAAFANIQLLVQPYTYDVIIDGVIFQDLNGFSKCHVEATTELTFFVDIAPINIGELIGLSGIDCTLNKTSNNTAKMTWGANPELTDDVLGCVIASRSSINGNVEVYNNCTSGSASGYEREVSVPVNGNTYLVKGELRQGDNVVSCNSIIFSPEDDAAGIFGISGLFGAILLFIALVLIYAGESDKQLIGGAVGIIGAFIIGLLNFPWLVVSSIVVFLVLITIIARYGRRPTQ